MITRFGEGKYFLYRHIRLDTNEPFYIGIGTIKPYYTFKSRYHRATVVNRNKYWSNVVSKTDYNIDILFESNDLQFITEKEIEFISLYGRKDLNSGSLVNLTDGGEGRRGDFRKTGRISSNRVKVYLYNLKGEFIKEFLSVVLCSHYLKSKPHVVSSALTGSGFCKNHFISRTYLGDKITAMKYNDKSKKHKPIIQFTLSGEYVREFKHSVEAEEITKILKSSINVVCNKGIRKTAGGYKWMFKNDYENSIGQKVGLNLN